MRAPVNASGSGMEELAVVLRVVLSNLRNLASFLFSILQRTTFAVIRNVEPASLARLSGRQLRDWELILARSLVA